MSPVLVGLLMQGQWRESARGTVFFTPVKASLLLPPVLYYGRITMLSSV